MGDQIIFPYFLAKQIILERLRWAGNKQLADVLNVLFPNTHATIENIVDEEGYDAQILHISKEAVESLLLQIPDHP